MEENNTKISVIISNYADYEKFEFYKFQHSFLNFNDLEREITNRLNILSEPDKLYVYLGSKKFVLEKRLSDLLDIKKHFELTMRNTIIAHKKIIAQSKKTRLEVRLSVEEKNQIIYNAEQVSMNLSDYSRQMLIYGKVLRISQEERRTLTGIGININQMAKKVNLGYIPEGLLIEFENTLKEIKKFYL